MAHQPQERVARADLRHLRKTDWAWAVGTFFGAGYLRPGPGTYGSIAGVLLWFFAAHLLRPTTAQLAGLTAGVAVLAMALGIPAATRVAREAGRDDPGFVVIDEVAGQMIALLGLAPVWPQALLALVLFRAYDITKPPPVRQLEALPEGTGIMLDDLAAGALACVTAHLLLGLAHWAHLH